MLDVPSPGGSRIDLAGFAAAGATELVNAAEGGGAAAGGGPAPPNAPTMVWGGCCCCCCGGLAGGGVPIAAKFPWARVGDSLSGCEFWRRSDSVGGYMGRPVTRDSL